MSARNSITDSAVHKFWDRYLNKLEKHGFKANMLSWYVIRSEQCLKAYLEENSKN